MFTLLGRLAYRRRWFVLVGTILFLAVSVLTGLSVFDKLKSGGFEDPEQESARAAAILAERFDAGSPDLVLLVSADEDVDSPGAARSGRQLTKRLVAEPGVEQVVSYWNPPDSGGGDPGLRSADGDKALVLVRLAGGEEQADLVSERLQADYGGQVGDLVVQIGGPGVGLGETIGEDLARAESIAIPITLVLLLLVFAGLVAALLPLMVGAIAILGTFLALYLVTQAAVALTLQTAGRTVAFSAITVAVSLSALLIFPLYFLRSFAYSGIAVVAIAAGAALLTLPALLAVLGPRVNRFAVGRKHSASASARGFWHSLSHAVMRRPVLTGLPVVVLLVSLAVPFLGVSFSLPDDRDLPPTSEARIVGDSVRDEFGGGAARSFPVVLPDATPEQTTALALRISALAEVNRVDTSTGSFAEGSKVAEPGPSATRFGDESGA